MAVSLGSVEPGSVLLGANAMTSAMIGDVQYWTAPVTIPDTEFEVVADRGSFDVNIDGWVGGPDAGGVDATVTRDTTITHDGAGSLKVTNDLGGLTVEDSDNFEGDVTTDWMRGSSDPTTTTITKLSSPVRNGTGALGLSSSAGGTIRARVVFANRTGGLSAGDSFTSTVWMRPVTGVAREVRLDVNLFYINGTGGQTYYATPNSGYILIQPNVWTEVTLNWTVGTPPAGFEAAEVFMEPSFVFRNSGANETLAVDDYQTTSGTSTAATDKLVAKGPINVAGSGNWSASGNVVSCWVYLPEVNLASLATWAEADAIFRDATIPWETRYSFMRNWYAANTGPTVTIDTVTPVLNPTVTNQTEADALVGKTVHGQITVSNNVTLHDFKYQRRKGIDVSTSAINRSGGGTLTIEDVEIDGDNDFVMIGAISGTTFHRLIARRLNIYGCCDGIRLGVNSTGGTGDSLVEQTYIHDPAVWDDAVEGRAWNTSTDPHADGIQMFRAESNGALIDKCFIDMGVFNVSHISAILIKADSAAISNNVIVRDTFLNGGHYQAYVHDGSTHTISANVVQFERTAHGPTWGPSGGIWSFLPTSRTDVPRTNCVRADTLAAVSTAEGPQANPVDPPTPTTTWSAKVEVQLSSTQEVSPGTLVPLQVGWNRIYKTLSSAELNDVSRLILTAEAPAVSGTMSVYWDTIAQGQFASGETPLDPDVLWQPDLRDGLTGLKTEVSLGASNLVTLPGETPPALQVNTVAGTFLGFQGRSRFYGATGLPAGASHLGIGEQREVYLEIGAKLGPDFSTVAPHTALMGLASIPDSQGGWFAPSNGVRNAKTFGAILRTADNDNLEVEIYAPWTNLGATTGAFRAVTLKDLSPGSTEGVAFDYTRNVYSNVLMRVLVNNKDLRDGLLEVWINNKKYASVVVQWNDYGDDASFNTLVYDLRAVGGNYANNSEITINKLALRSAADVVPGARPVANAPSGSLLSDPGFDLGLGGFVATNANTTISAATAIGIPHQGAGALRMTSVAAGEVKTHSPAIQVTPSTIYHFSCHVKFDQTTPVNVGLQADWFSDTAASPASYISSSMHYALGSDTQWQVRDPSTNPGGVVPPAGAKSCSLAVVWNATGAGQKLLVDTFDARISGTVTTPPPPPPDEPTPTSHIYSAQFNESQTITYSYPGNHPHLALEWSGLNTINVSGGTAKVTGNSHTNSYQGYWRGYGKGFSDDKARFGGVNQTSIFRTRLRTTRHWTTVHNGTHAGLKIGVKWRNNSGNPYGVDDWRSVLGGNPNVPSPGSCIFVCGMGPEGRFEVARNPIGNAPYMSFPSARYKAYSAGTWQYVTIRYDQIGDTQLRVRMWRNSDSTHSMTGTPDYDFTGTSPGPNSQQVFLWYRVDFVDPEWDYFTIEQKPY